MVNWCRNSLIVEFFAYRKSNSFLNTVIYYDSDLEWFIFDLTRVTHKLVEGPRRRNWWGFLNDYSFDSDYNIVQAHFQTAWNPPKQALEYLFEHRDRLGIENIRLEALEPKIDFAFAFDNGRSKEYLIPSVLETREYPFKIIPKNTIADIYFNTARQTIEQADVSS